MEKIQLGLCHVCKKNESIGVFGSTLGPFSQGYCKECCDHYAENKEALLFTIKSCDGPDNVADWVTCLTTFHDGRYITWEEIVALYKIKHL